MGQALCKRTLNIVEALNDKHGDRLRFYLSKADEAGGESDRQVGAKYMAPPPPYIQPNRNFDGNVRIADVGLARRRV